MLNTINTSHKRKADALATATFLFPITVITDGHGTLNRIYVFVEQIEFSQNVI